MLKPRRFQLHIESTHFQKSFESREDFDIGFENVSMGRSWPTFENENTNIKDVVNGFFRNSKECT